MWRPTRRQILASGLATGAAAAASGAFNVASAQAQRPPRLRIGLVVPARTGLSTVRTSINDYPGEGAREGALLAEANIGEEATAQGMKLELLHANSPIADAAQRAGVRLAETGDICALVGGIGDGQAEVLSAIAERYKIPFFNVGNQRDALRNRNCGRYTFHVEASAAMYLDAMVMWGAAKGYKRWFLVNEATADGRALKERATKAVAKHGAGATVAGTAEVQVEQPVYYNEFNAVERANADVILMLVSAVDQIAWLAQQEGAGFTVPALAYPEPISQTRDYISSVRALAPETNPRQRFAYWETTLTAKGANDYNERFHTRWSEPADPTSWGAYQSIRMIYEAVKATGSTDSAAMVRYLENPATTFNIGKGAGVSFRPWDHQLRQPIYVIDIDQEIEWVRTDFDTWIGLGKFSSEVPMGNPANAADAVALLDRLGDGASDTACRMA